MKESAMTRKSVITAAVVLAFSSLLAGCYQVGPGSVKSGRTEYNIAIQKTNGQQLLLNLVRLRYRDTPYFLQVASVSTSFEMSANASVSGFFPKAAPDSFGAGAGVELVDKPTITYTPLHGDRFVKQLMSPVDLSTVLLLYHSGWSVERIGRILFQSINGVANAPRASGPTPAQPPVYRDFLEVAKLMRSLQTSGKVMLGRAVAHEGKQEAIEIHLAQGASSSPEWKRLAELLKLPPGRESFHLTAAATGGPGQIAVVPRSLLTAMYYVSQSVEPPAADCRAGRVTMTRGQDGKVFDWQNLTGGLMRIRSGVLRPSNAYVSVKYRGSWFYIDDSDLTSKSTFSLLVQLFALQAGDVKSSGPILTLPVAR
jgi:hypothetical protein